MNHCGIDLGKKSSNYCVMNDERKIVREGKVRNRPENLKKALGKEPLRIVVEASSKAFWIADVLTAQGHTVIVTDPSRTKAIGSGLIKHDKLDARVLATLCQANVLAEVDRPSVEQRLARMPVAARDLLVRNRTSLLNNVRSLLDSEGIELCPCSPRAFADEAAGVMPKEMEPALAPLLELVVALNDKIAAYDAELERVTKDDADMQRLMTVPGVGPVTAAMFVYVMRDPGRFKSGRAASAYVGLVPSLYQSGKTMRRGRITKRGNRQLRWLLTMAANSLLRSSKQSSLRDWGLALAERIGRKKAKVAVARKLTTVLLAMWKNQTTFEARLHTQAR